MNILYLTSMLFGLDGYVWFLGFDQGRIMPFLKQNVSDTWSPVWVKACVIYPYVSAMASSLFQNTSEGLLDMGYTTEVLVIFFSGWPFH